MTELVCPNCGQTRYDMDHRCERCREKVLAREQWKEGQGARLKEEPAQLRALGGWRHGSPPTFREQMADRYGSWEAYQQEAERAEEGSNASE